MLYNLERLEGLKASENSNYNNNNFFAKFLIPNQRKLIFMLIFIE